VLYFTPCFTKCYAYMSQLCPSIRQDKRLTCNKKKKRQQGSGRADLQGPEWRIRIWIFFSLKIIIIFGSWKVPQQKKKPGPEGLIVGSWDLLPGPKWGPMIAHIRGLVLRVFCTNHKSWWTSFGHGDFPGGQKPGPDSHQHGIWSWDLRLIQ
jgi:hypothetical protein